jgi:hypothetical protein
MLVAIDSGVRLRLLSGPSCFRCRLKCFLSYYATPRTRFVEILVLCRLYKLLFNHGRSLRFLAIDGRLAAKVAFDKLMSHLFPTFHHC